MQIWSWLRKAVPIMVIATMLASAIGVIPVMAAAPTISGISPSSGPVVGGTNITITGSGFASPVTLTIGGAAATSVVIVNDTSITAITANGGTAGAKDVSVITSGGAATLTGGFTYVAAPTVSGISPSSGPLVGGTPVTITGTGFVSPATVTIGSAAATSINVVNDTTITATTSSGGTAGAKNVVVTNPDSQTGTLSSGFTYVAAPTVTNIVPAAGPVAGGTPVTITGTGFVSGATVTIGGVAATSVTWVNATTITATSAAVAAGAKDVVVTNPDSQFGTLAAGFTYAAVPTITNISPNSGPLLSGTSITITGTGFLSPATVTIGGVAATTISVVNSTTITAHAPAGTAGAKDVVVGTPGGSVTLTGGYTYLAVTISSISPNSGPLAGGTSVTITGTGFASPITVTIGGIAPTGVTIVNATTITATTANGNTAGVKDVIVITSAGTATLTDGFTYIPVTITSISPNSGPVGGGTPVTITGTGFVSGATVTIGSVAATSVVVASATSITAVTPAGTAGAKDVVVTTSGGSATLTGGFTYLVVTITSISPNAGPLVGGTPVTITGTGFIERGDGDNWRRSSNQRHGRKCNLHYCGYTGWYRWG